MHPLDCLLDTLWLLKCDECKAVFHGDVSDCTEADESLFKVCLTSRPGKSAYIDGVTCLPIILALLAAALWLRDPPAVTATVVAAASG